MRDEVVFCSVLENSKWKAYATFIWHFSNLSFIYAAFKQKKRTAMALFVVCTLHLQGFGIIPPLAMVMCWRLALARLLPHQVQRVDRVDSIGFALGLLYAVISS